MFAIRRGTPGHVSPGLPNHVLTFSHSVIKGGHCVHFLSTCNLWTFLAPATGYELTGTRLEGGDQVSRVHRHRSCHHHHHGDHRHHHHCHTGAAWGSGLIKSDQATRQSSSSIFIIIKSRLPHRSRSRKGLWVPQLRESQGRGPRRP